MDTISLYYLTELVKDMNMTKTAARLFISQQTLSNHILRLEQYYDTPLFERKPALSLTYAGEQVVKYADRVLKDQQNLKDQLADIAHQDTGILRFGASSQRLNTCLPYILPGFSSRYPGVQVDIVDNYTLNLEPMILRNDLDLAIIMSGSKSPKIKAKPLMEDIVYLCVKESLLRKQLSPEHAEALIAGNRRGIRLEEVKDLPVCLPGFRLGNMIRQCYYEEGITPKVQYTTTYVYAGVMSAFMGLTASFVTDISLLNYADHIPEEMRLFPILREGVPLRQELFLIRNRERFLSAYAQYFVKLLDECFSERGILGKIREMQGGSNGTAGQNGIR